MNNILITDPIVFEDFTLNICHNSPFSLSDYIMISSSVSTVKSIKEIYSEWALNIFWQVSLTPENRVEQIMRHRY